MSKPLPKLEKTQRSMQLTAITPSQRRSLIRLFSRALDIYIDQGYLACCGAIQRAYFLSRGDDFRTYAVAMEYFAELFRPRRHSYSDYWWNIKDRESRVQALLLAIETLRHP